MGPFGINPPSTPPPTPVVQTNFNFWDTPEGRQMMGLPPLPPPLWMPIYQGPATISQPTNTGGVASQPINSQYLLSVASAYYLAITYGAVVITQPFEGAGGIEASSAVEYILVFTAVNPATGKTFTFNINAGTLAYYYCPAGGVPAEGAVANPGIAVSNCYACINGARLDALRLVR